MRLLTYAFAAALLWALTATGPQIQPGPGSASRTEAPAPSRSVHPQYPR